MSGALLAPGPELWEESIEATRKMVDEQVEPLRDSAGLTWRTELLGGPPYEALEELSGAADLLVVGNHGRRNVPPDLPRQRQPARLPTRPLPRRRDPPPTRETDATEPTSSGRAR